MYMRSWYDIIKATSQQFVHAPTKYKLQTRASYIFVRTGSSRTFWEKSRTFRQYKNSCFLPKHQLGAHVTFKI